MTETSNLVCPGCRTVLARPRKPGIYGCRPCDATFYIPPIYRSWLGPTQGAALA